MNLNKTKAVTLRVLELLVVGAALAVLTTRSVCSKAYAKYRARGGRNGFAAWFAREKFNAALPWTEDFDEAMRKEDAEAKARRARAKAAREVARLEAAERKLLEQLAKSEESSRRSRRGIGAAAKPGTRTASRKGGHGGAVKSGGKSSYVAASGKTPYRVTGIRGIAFGSTENAPAANVRPLLSVSYDGDGNQVFHQIKWRENKPLTESIYGFDKAWLDHSFESERLSSVTLNKSFPFTEEGLREAMDFYRKMSAEASADLGFEVVDTDHTGELARSSICEFTNRDGDTVIHGGISAWSDNALTVTLKVTDKTYANELKSQSDAAYDAGLAESVDARVEVWKQDHTARKLRVNEYLEK